jgi:hypothetical protein
MPIGTGKVGLFGGTAIEAGSETFNAPGIFTAPADLKTVQLTGNGATGNAGNPGNPGGDGIGGNGGSGGLIPNYWVGNGCAALREDTNNSIRIIAVQRSGGGSAEGPVNSPWCPFINPPGGPGNPGNAGGTTSALGYSWTGGAAGNGGTGGVNGFQGNNGGHGVTVNRNQNTEGNNPLNISPCYIRKVVSSNGSFGGSGLHYGGQGGGAGLYRAFIPQCPSNNPIGANAAGASGGLGGGGALVDQAGTPAPSVRFGHGIAYVTNTACTGCANFAAASNSTTNAAGGRGASTGLNGANSAPNTNNTLAIKLSTNGQAASVVRAGAGGGGGGAAAYVAPDGAFSSAGTGGGGGGSGSAGTPGSGAGNPGGAGIPATFNCVPVSEGCYPVVVGAGGQITISWNAQ